VTDTTTPATFSAEWVSARPGRVTVVLIALLWLAGCQHVMPAQAPGLLFERLEGGQFSLRRDVTIPAGHVKVIFQNGHAALGASEYEPRCELEVRHIMETSQIIPAGDYRIGKVLGLLRYVDRQPDGLKLAAAGARVHFADDGFNDWSMHTYRMQLLDDRQSDPPALTCGGAYNYPFYSRYPTLQEMRESLGEYATLSLR